MKLSMPHRLARLIAVAMAWLSSAQPGYAGSLQVSTTTLEVAAPGAATSMVLRNSGAEALNAQIRIMKWSQTDGVEQLTATQDVVASPPFAAIGPGRDYTVRVVRVGQRPVQQEESYRLLIDELPTTDKSAKSRREVCHPLLDPGVFRPRCEGDQHTGLARPSPARSPSARGHQLWQQAGAPL